MEVEKFEALFANAVKDGKVKPDKKETFASLGYEKSKEIFDAMPENKGIQDLQNEITAGQEGSFKIDNADDKGIYEMMKEQGKSHEEILADPYFEKYRKGKEVN